MKGMILLQNYFEDHEAITTLDILRRANLTVDEINMSDNEIITTQYGNKLISSRFYKDINISDYDFLVIPGGRAVSMYYVNDERVSKIIDHFVMEKKLIACICAAPVLLKKYLKKNYTCFPSYVSEMQGIYTGNGVEVVDNFVLGKSMYYTIPFALEIVKYLTKNSELLLKQIRAD